MGGNSPRPRAACPADLMQKPTPIVFAATSTGGSTTRGGRATGGRGAGGIATGGRQTGGTSRGGTSTGGQASGGTSSGGSPSGGATGCGGGSSTSSDVVVNLSTTQQKIAGRLLSDWGLSLREPLKSLARAVALAANYNSAETFTEIS